MIGVLFFAGFLYSYYSVGKGIKHQIQINCQNDNTSIQCQKSQELSKVPVTSKAAVALKKKTKRNKTFFSIVFVKYNPLGSCTSPLCSLNTRRGQSKHFIPLSVHLSNGICHLFV